MKRKNKLCLTAGAAMALALGLQMVSYGAGWSLEGDEWHYYDSSGDLVTDQWKKSGNFYFYLDGDGNMAKSQLIEDDDNYYYVDSIGRRVSNQWRQLVNEDPDEEDESDMVWYYFGPSGRAYKAPDSGKTSFKSITNGAGQTRRYAFDSEGRMLYGWLNENSERLTGEDAWREGVYYCGGPDDGIQARGEWRELEAIDDENDDGEFNETYWFYFSSNGRKTANTTKTINGFKYRFLEDGNAQYRWYATPSDASPSSADQWYYKRPDQCWLATGWFKTVPSEDVDPEAYDSGDEYWFYGLSSGGVVSSQIRSIDNHSYGFNEVGEMLHGLYKMTVDGKTILTYTKIESADELPDKDAPEDVYYFGDSPFLRVAQTDQGLLMQLNLLFFLRRMRFDHPAVIGKSPVAAPEIGDFFQSEVHFAQVQKTDQAKEIFFGKIPVSVGPFMGF